MAELLSVQVHVPLTKTECKNVIERRVPRSSGRLKKVDNATAQDGSMSAKFDYLPRHRAVDVEFRALTYSVSEGRKKGTQSFDHEFTNSCIATKYYVSNSFSLSG